MSVIRNSIELNQYDQAKNEVLDIIEEEDIMFLGTYLYVVGLSMFESSIDEFIIIKYFNKWCYYMIK